MSTRINSKATLKVSMSDLSSHIPVLLHPGLRGLPFYAKKSDMLIIQADENRKQSDNTRACIARLYQIIMGVARDAIPGETSETQKQHVEKL
jgi:peptidyl-tRNA hydrolase ICT1